MACEKEHRISVNHVIIIMTFMVLAVWTEWGEGDATIDGPYT